MEGAIDMEENFSKSEKRMRDPLSKSSPRENDKEWKVTKIRDVLFVSQASTKFGTHTY